MKGRILCGLAVGPIGVTKLLANLSLWFILPEISCSSSHRIVSTLRRGESLASEMFFVLNIHRFTSQNNSVGFKKLELLLVSKYLNFCWFQKTWTSVGFKKTWTSVGFKKLELLLVSKKLELLLVPKNLNFCWFHKPRTSVGFKNLNFCWFQKTWTSVGLKNLNFCWFQKTSVG